MTTKDGGGFRDMQERSFGLALSLAQNENVPANILAKIADHLEWLWDNGWNALAFADSLRSILDDTEGES